MVSLFYPVEGGMAFLRGLHSSFKNHHYFVLSFELVAEYIPFSKYNAFVFISKTINQKMHT